MAAAFAEANPGVSEAAAQRIVGLAISTSQHEFHVALQSTLQTAAEDVRHGRRFTVDQVLDGIVAQHSLHAMLQQGFAHVGGRLVRAARPGRLGSRAAPAESSARRAAEAAVGGSRSTGQAARPAASAPARSVGAAAARPPTTEEVRAAIVEERVGSLAAEVTRLRRLRGVPSHIRSALRTSAAAVARLERGFWASRQEGPPGQRRTVVRARNFRLYQLVAVEQRVAALRAAITAAARRTPDVPVSLRGHRVLRARPELDEQFRAADENFVRTGGRGPRPSLAFAQAVGALERVGLRAQLDAMLGEVFRPRIEGAELSRARLLQGIAEITELAGLVRNRTGILTEAGRTRLAEELSGQFHQIEADYRRGFSPDGGRLPPHLWRSTDGRPRPDNRIDRAARSAREEIIRCRERLGGSPLAQLLGLVRLRRRVTALSDEVRAHVRRVQRHRAGRSGASRFRAAHPPDHDRRHRARPGY